MCMRFLVRRERHISGSLVFDCLIVTLFAPCALIQLAAEVAPAPIAGAPVDSLEMIR